MQIRIAGVQQDSIVDGRGLRFAVFVQGCPHHCPGCHNPETHDPDAGKLVGTDSIIAQMASNPLWDGVTLSGGEPFMQPFACAEIARAAHARDMDVWCYTGYTLEELQRISDADALLKEIDVLVDGRFLQQQRSLELAFRGSRNQRVIDMNVYRRTGQVTSPCL